MTRLLAVLIAGSLPLSALAQDQSGDRPAPSAIRTSRYPLLSADGKVTFQVKAPEAKAVSVVPRGDANGLGSKPIPMTKGSDGAWTVTVPVSPGFHYYQFDIDGLRTVDPHSKSYFGWAEEGSALDVPNPAFPFTSVDPKVPHGDVRICSYYSPATEAMRLAYVYTPPGYEENPAKRYPVLYLQHGSGENNRGWTENGLANITLDNLIASKEAVPMLVVMETGYATTPNRGGEQAPPAAGQGRGRGPDGFSQVVLKDLIPFVDKKFRTIPDAAHRAIAGTSMGGGQAMNIGLNNPDVFANVGAFSGGAGAINVESSYGGLFKDPAVANAKIKVLWIGAGTEDTRAINGVRAAHEVLEKQGVRHVAYEAPGGHVWGVWRGFLKEFSTKLFKDG